MDPTSNSWSHFLALIDTSHTVMGGVTDTKCFFLFKSETQVIITILETTELSSLGSFNGKRQEAICTLFHATHLSSFKTPAYQAAEPMPPTLFYIPSISERQVERTFPLTNQPPSGLISNVAFESNSPTHSRGVAWMLGLRLCGLCVSSQGRVKKWPQNHNNNRATRKSPEPSSWCHGVLCVWMIGIQYSHTW